MIRVSQRGSRLHYWLPWPSLVPNFLRTGVVASTSYPMYLHPACNHKEGFGASPNCGISYQLQELNPWGAQVNLGLPSSRIVLANSLLDDRNVGKVEDKSTLGSRGYRPDLFKETHNHQGLLYTVTGRLRALRDV